MMYLAYVLLTLHMFLGIFLIGLILLQRGRGGGLAGSFGGMGGQSAFGTKAGDMFTRITIVVAIIWILLACVCIVVVDAANKGRFKPGAADVVDKAPPIDKAGAMGDAGADGKAQEEGAADGKAVAPTDAGKGDQPAGDAKKTVDKKDEGAAEAKKPDGAEAKPEGAKSDVPANAKEKPEKPEPKQPE